MAAIFISYRREDAEDSARALYETLLREFGQDRLFMDVEAIALGSDFRQAVESSLDNCGVFLTIIGPTWLDARAPNDPSGPRRLDNPGDYVRLEVATALKRGAGLPVIPVLVRGASMPSAAQLPDDLKDLAYRNALTLSHLDWNGNIQHLVSAIRPKIGCDDSGQKIATAASETAAAAPAPPPPPPAASRSTRKAVLIGVAALIVAAGIGYFVLRPKQPAPSPANTPAASTPAANTRPATNPAPASNSAAAAAPGASTPIPVTVEANRRQRNSTAGLSIDGSVVAAHYSGQEIQLQLTPGTHSFRFFNPADPTDPTVCHGNFLVAAGQSRFTPRVGGGNCALQPHVTAP
ncbi:MAG: TIR domain-containing protein [Acidobacteriaceae bacterium]